MSLIHRPFYICSGCFEVFAEGWKRVAGDPFVRGQKSSQGGFLTFQLWLPGVHLIVDLKGQPEVVAG